MPAQNRSNTLTKGSTVKLYQDSNDKNHSNNNYNNNKMMTPLECVVFAPSLPGYVHICTESWNHAK